MSTATSSTTKAKKKKKIDAITAEEEGMIANITSVMVTSLSTENNTAAAGGGGGDADSEAAGTAGTALQHLLPLKRFLNKFREKSFEKCDRLVELHQKYLMKVVTAETLYLTEQQEDEEDDDSVLDRYRNDAGMRTLRSIGLTIGGLCRISSSLRK